MSDYPSSLDVRPLTTWPGQLTSWGKRKRAPFSAALGSTLGLLDVELRALSAKHPVLEVAIPREKWRVDGRPYANAVAEHPGVVLSLPTTNQGPLRYATDVFTMWQDNLRAIALGLEALRKVERYGITRRGEQYVGFRAIEAGTATALPARPRMTVEEAARFVLRTIGDPPSPTVDAVASVPATREAAYREAARRLHPDAGGSTEEFQRLQDAKRVLDEHGAR